MMYPTYVHVMFTFFICERVGFFDRATSLISDRDRDLDLHLKKEEWVSVLELSTIWNMTKVCTTKCSQTHAGPTDPHIYIY